MRIYYSDENCYIGNWRDSDGKDNVIRINKKWGEHLFTSEEVETLLEGKQIRFYYNNGFITGHLQYTTFKNKTKIRFCPDFSKEYDLTPKYNPELESNFYNDQKKELIMRDFMVKHYYSLIRNRDGSSARYTIVTNKKMQDEGKDILLEVDNKTIAIEEKAQTDYINNPTGPLPTFAFELYNSASGRIGWFIDSNKKSDYYNIIWPHSTRDLNSISYIEYAEFALISVNRLREFIFKNYMTPDKLLEYAKLISSEKLIGAEESNNKLYYSQPPFARKQVYIVYTKSPGSGMVGKVERPVNLVISKNILLGLSSETRKLYG